MSATIKEEEMQEQILQTAKQLFQLHGFKRVTIDDIAKAIGKARSSLYYYYKTKDEILAAVIAADIAELITAIAFAVAQAPSAEEKVKAFFRTKLQIILEKRAFFHSLDEGMDPAELSGYQKTKLAVHQQIRQQEGELLSQIITESIESGEITRLGQKDQRDLVFVLLSCLQGLKREMVIQNDFSNIESAVEILVRSFIHGLKK
ncbi:MAG TPA: TetR/AcrR family transcriptional regulator [Puia sp.]|nr:TetR/AcrR family transcriptional regulator [Puia sp.]